MLVHTFALAGRVFGPCTAGPAPPHIHTRARAARPRGRRQRMASGSHVGHTHTRVGQPLIRLDRKRAATHTHTHTLNRRQPLIRLDRRRARVVHGPHIVLGTPGGNKAALGPRAYVNRSPRLVTARLARLARLPRLVMARLARLRISRLGHQLGHHKPSQAGHHRHRLARLRISRLVPPPHINSAPRPRVAPVLSWPA